MNKVRLITLLCIASLLPFAIAFPSSAAKRPSHLPQAVKLAPAAPLDLSGELHGAPYRIRVPEVWNGTLLVFLHGYRDKADHPGEIDNRNADVAPNAALEAPLLAQGFALAGSAYRDNGWEIEGGIQDTKALTILFGSLVGKPQRTILASASFGSLIALESIERFNGIYDGALCFVRRARDRLASGIPKSLYISPTTSYLAYRRVGAL